MTVRVPVLVARGVRRSYPGGIEALAGVDLELLPGETLGLVGGNGAGKSTLLRLLAGLDEPDGGSIQVLGIDVARDPSGVRGVIGVLPAEDDAPPHLTAREAVTLVGRLHGLDAGEAEQRTADLLELLAVAPRDRDRLVAAHSTGTRRKVLLACALVGAPAVLLLDEPLANLDPPSAAVVRSTLAGLAARGRAVLFSSHALESIEPVCDRVAVLHDGRLLAAGTPAALRAAAGLGPGSDLAAAVLALSGAGTPREPPEWLA